MKLRKIIPLMPLLLAASLSQAETSDSTLNGSVFQFSTEVSREIEKDLMQAVVFSRETGKNLPDLKKAVATQLNQVIEQAKQSPDIEIQTDGIRNNMHYDEKGKVIGWVAEGYVTFKSKNFEAVANLLDHLGEKVAISDVNFSVSPDKLTSLEDEMTLEIIKKFQHKAEIIQKGLNASQYVISDIQLDTPNGEQHYVGRPVFAMAKATAMESSDAIPLEAGKARITARAMGKIKFN